MKLTGKVFLMVYLLQCEVLCLPLNLPDVLKPPHVYDDHEIHRDHGAVETHRNSGPYLSLRSPNIFKPLEKIKKLFSNIENYEPFQTGNDRSMYITPPFNDGDIPPMPKNYNMPPGSNTKIISDLRKLPHENTTRDTTEMTPIIEETDLNLNSTNSKTGKTDNYMEQSSIKYENTSAKHKKEEVTLKFGNSYITIDKQKLDSMIIFRDDDNNIIFNGLTTTAAVDSTEESSTTEDYESTTFEDDTFNRVGAVPPAVVASLLG